MSEFLNKMQISQRLDKISIFHIILSSFALHLFVMSQPNFEMLDEMYFTNFTRWLMLGIDHTPYQLPGLSIIASPFFYVFGDNWFSWRFPIIIFGMVFLYFNYKVIEHLSNKKIALLSSVVLSLSPMIFVHSTLMLRDIPVMALGFFSIYLYFKQKYYFAALVIGLTALIKETAMFFLIFVVIHYLITNRENLTSQLLSKKLTKTPFIAFLILVSAFLIPLVIYENSVTVLEYETRFPDVYIYPDGSERKILRFDIVGTNTPLLQKQITDFKYVNIITNPIDHLKTMFTTGYLDQRSTEGEFGIIDFSQTFIPFLDDDSVQLHQVREFSKKDMTEDGIEKNIVNPSTLWIQSQINPVWYLAFWSSISLIGYGLFQRFYNKIPLSKTISFIICGLVFFIPFLFINTMRDTYAYYMIYFIPIMMFGFISIIYKIPSKILRLTILASFLLFMLNQFITNFPLFRYNL